jgi:hypothetical protein
MLRHNKLLYEMLTRQSNPKKTQLDFLFRLSSSKKNIKVGAIMSIIAEYAMPILRIILNANCKVSKTTMLLFTSRGCFVFICRQKKATIT